MRNKGIGDLLQAGIYLKWLFADNAQVERMNEILYYLHSEKKVPKQHP